MTRRYPIGAETSADGVDFRVWAPARERVTAVVTAVDGTFEAILEPEADGYFHGFTTRARAGALYRFRLDDDSRLYPDPASRFQPEGPHGPSMVVDPHSYTWRDGNWMGIERNGQVIYELHLGTFTPEGTWSAARLRLPHLADVGITVIEVMPVAECPGAFGWGYDGVDFFAPSHRYGSPDDFRRFVDRAHELGLGVILDVVYNHFGPDGNYLHAFSRDYFTDRHTTDWGEAINYDGERSGPVRELITRNAAYWIDEFHLDGLRLDATQDIHDDSAPHLLAELARSAREAAGDRSIYLVAENEPQHARLVTPPRDGGYGLDALWNDDFHHAATVALTGQTSAFYSDYRGTPQELVSTAKRGFLFQGQWHTWQKKRRGTPALGLSPDCFVTFLENHDQVANSARGLRSHQTGSPGRHRALTALLLLGPGTPLLFQGQEFNASAPFLFFADHHAELAEKVHAGRRKFLAQFPAIATPAMQTLIPDPADRATFERCRLDWDECERNQEALDLHRDLLRLRREDPVLSNPSRDLDGAVLGSEAFVLRDFGKERADRLLVVNLGRDLEMSPAPEPLLAEPEDRLWELAWCSEDPRYGGGGVPRIYDEGRWFLPAASAAFFTSRRSQPQ